MRINLAILLGFVTLLVSTHSLAVPVIQHWKTDNGASVYFVPTSGLPILDAQLVFDAGSTRDAKKNGVAALTSALLDQGAAGQSAQQIAEQLESVGAQMGVSTSRDFTSVSYRSLTDAEALKTSWGILNDVLNKPDFPAMAFKREKKRTLLGIKQRQESPAILAQLALYREIYNNHPYASAIQGVEETVSALKVSDLKQFYQQYYCLLYTSPSPRD